MTTEYLAIYEQPLDPEIKEQIMRYCSDKPLAPVSDDTLRNIAITYGAICNKDVRLFWFQDPDTATMLKLFESVPIYIGQFDTMPLSKFHAFEKSAKRQELLMNNARHIKKELVKHKRDLKNICKSSRQVFSANIENNVIDILNRTHKIISGNIRLFFAEHSAHL
jgi:hypothetical protein